LATASRDDDRAAIGHTRKHSATARDLIARDLPQVLIQIRPRLRATAADHAA